MPTDRPLPIKWQRFVDALLSDPHLNATQAYVQAGYKARGHAAEANANRLLKNAEVARAIRAAQDKLSGDARVDAAFVLKGLKAEAERHGKGASHSARVQAYGLLARCLGLLNDKLKVEHTGKGGGPIQYADATDADLDAEIERLKNV